MPSSADLNERFIGFLAAHPDYFTGTVMLDLLLAVLGDHAHIYDASTFIYTYARKQGYYIPSYPLDGISEIRSFFEEYGVEDIPGWYERIGVSRAVYEVLAQRRLLVVRDEQDRRKAFVMGIEGYVDDEEARRLVSCALSFLAGSAEGDPTLF